MASVVLMIVKQLNVYEHAAIEVILWKLTKGLSTVRIIQILYMTYLTLQNALFSENTQWHVKYALIFGRYLRVFIWYVRHLLIDVSTA